MLTLDNGQLLIAFALGLKSICNSMPLLKEELAPGAPFAIQMGVVTPMIAPNSRHPELCPILVILPTVAHFPPFLTIAATTTAIH